MFVFHFCHENHDHGWPQPTCGIIIDCPVESLPGLGSRRTALGESRGISISWICFRVLYLPVSVVSTVRTNVSPGLGNAGDIDYHTPGRCRGAPQPVPLSWFLRNRSIGEVLRKNSEIIYIIYGSQLRKISYMKISITGYSYCLTKRFTCNFLLIQIYRNSF